MKLSWRQIITAFILGGMLGAAAAHHFLPAPFLSRGGSYRFHEKMMGRLTSELRLAPDQREKISGILDESRDKLDALRRESKPRFEAIRAETKEKIRAILNPEQIDKFEKINQKMEERWKKKKEGFARDRSLEKTAG